MTHLPFIDSTLIEQFLWAQHFRHPATCKNYAGILRNFSGFLANHGLVASPNVSIVQQWLTEHSLKWPAHILYHRSFLIERYLQWLHDQGLIASNPFAELHRQYGPRTTPIVRALVSEDSNAALHEQRRLPRFGSFLGSVMDEHIAHMRVLGYRYRTEEQTLLRFDRFLQCHSELAGRPLAELVEHWSQEAPSPYHLYDARRAGRIASKAIHRIDPRVPILPIGPMESRVRLGNTSDLPISTRTRRYVGFCRRRCCIPPRRHRGVPSPSLRCSCLPTAPGFGEVRSRD